MIISVNKNLAVDVWFNEERMYIRLIDGREIGVPLAWFPKLEEATENQRKDWSLIGQGLGIHWSEVDEDILIANLLN